MLYKIDPDVVRRCKMFADNVWETNKEEYKRRGQSNPNSTKAQIETGKIAEFTAYEHLTQFFGFKCSQPDMNIYKPWEKSYSADLTANGMNFHVKNILDNSAQKYGLSWLFQKVDPVTTKPNDNDYIVLTYLDKERVQIMKIVSAKDLVTLYKEPKLEYHKQEKIAIYWQDIKHIPTMEKEIT